MRVTINTISPIHPRQCIKRTPLRIDHRPSPVYMQLSLNQALYTSVQYINVIIDFVRVCGLINGSFTIYIKITSGFS